VQQLEEMTEDDYDDNKLKAAADQYKKYGTYVTRKVREAMIELLFKHIDECKQLLNTEYLVDDICKLVRTSTGKIQAVKGEHDDSLFSYLHTLYVYYTGDNLVSFGIMKNDHPVIGPVQTDVEERLLQKDPMSNFFSTEEVTFESITLEDNIQVEEQIKFLVNTNFSGLEFRNEVYSKQKGGNNPYDDSVSISPFFFDMVNGTGRNEKYGNEEDW